MLTRTAVFGHIVWLTEDEINSKEVIDEIEKLKRQGKVAVFCSGKQELKHVISKLLEKNVRL